MWNFVKIGLNRNRETVDHLPGLRTLQSISTSEYIRRIIILILLERKRDFFFATINEV